MSGFFADKTIVVPYDFSDHAAAAVAEAREIGTASARIHVLHVLVPLEVITIEPGVLVDMGNDAERIESAVAGMKHHIGSASGDIQFAARVGDPGTEVVEYAHEVDADLIMMPSHGRTGLKRMLLGSVAERVIRHSECPVLVLRGRHRDNP